MRTTPAPATSTTTTWTIRYRHDRPGPAALLLESNGRVHLYARGKVGPPLSTAVLDALVRGPGRWVTSSGRISWPDPRFPT